MRFTIERIRLLVVVAAAVLIAALGLFLVAAKWKNQLIRHDIPERLAKDIEQEANGFSFVHAYGAHSQYKIHASKEVQLKDGRILLLEVRIELFGPDGSLMDEITGDTFEYDQKSGLAIAVGPVEMVLTQPASGSAAAGKEGGANEASRAPSQTPRQIHVKTSAVTFDQDTGMVATVQPVSFTITQGFGNAVGATYDSQSGYLTLDKQVELTTTRGADTVKIHAQHAEFDRGAGQCWLRAATADARGAEAMATQAKIAFRKDGSAERLDATDGFTLATATGGHVAAPMATMDFDEHNQPVHGHLGGGVTMDSAKEGRTVHGTSPTAELEFAANGELHHAHLERGVTFASEQTRPSDGQAATMHTSRSWRSPVADVDLRAAGKGRVEPATLKGTGGVVITSESRRGDSSAVPSKMVADEVRSDFGPNSALRSMTGVGHARMEKTTATGTRQAANGDRLQASFAEDGEQESREQGSEGTTRQGEALTTAAAGVESAELDGHVTLFQQPAEKAGGQQQAPLRATAGKAVYEGTGEWLHLTVNPRVEDGGLEMTAETVDVSQQSGDAFAHGNVKTTWTGGAMSGRQTSAASGAGEGTVAFGGNGPAHVIASDAQLNESTGEATFRGHARLWQQANTVSGPVIILNQHLQTLVARTTDAADPVQAVLLSASGAPGMGRGPAQSGSHEGGANPSGKASAPSVIRVRGGDLWYSDAEHRATMRNGVLGAVVAETGTATSSSDDVDLRLMPAGANGGQAQVDRMTASGHVLLTSQTHRGTGQQLVYSSTTGEYVLTGTTSAPPRMSDPAQGSVTGEALIFHSRDDSVSIEGGGRETITQTTAPEAHGK